MSTPQKRIAERIDQALPLQTSRIPRFLHFPLLFTISLGLSATLYTAASGFLGSDLGRVSRRLTEGWQLAGLVAWRAVELGVGWWGSFDGVDYASLIVLSRLPTFFLLTTFYNIPGTTVVGCLVIDVITNSLPFLLLRPLLPQHKSSSVKSRGSARSVINDLPIRLTTSLLAAAIHATVIYVSYQTWLPIHLVEHFDGLRDISAAHSSAPIYLIASLLPAGYAARDLLFTPYVVKRAETERDVQLAFDPETATFAETLQQNLWGFSRPTKFLVKRLATVAVVTGSSTWLQTFVTLEGVESYGALGWSGMWVLATALTGVAFWWVGGA